MKNTNLPVIAFDADDTLWPNEPYFREAEKDMMKILTPYFRGGDLMEHLYQQEIKNLHIFGYGAKGFTLSMIESAIELSEGTIPGSEIQKIIDLGKQIMTYPIELLEGVEDTLITLREHRLVLITKGDLFDQESKIARSGLANHFDAVEIVSEKDDETYEKLLKRHKIKPENFWMIGNSLKSDVLPIARIGGTGVHIPYESTWQHEQVTTDAAMKETYHELSSIRELPSLIAKVCDSK
ncbi:HAD family hydrolase [Sansalvadorimonas sp. 2012CJ34-2]|uniref:HAD family hydrolase n=1 Tax=Parendozoicomonas callyspongiae TaxID=2942213 RepID=A0ABT0PF77_9GAMM|nr:HAD family hydrolase [Sansalvadorimonas sp. 2012CJ34-2]MCL6270029.1 HAD family hydrolase [Sansalvadorimonas sp. 2012CJ34-2]